jgi:uncharacterized protein (DUF2141 family)
MRSGIKTMGAVLTIAVVGSALALAMPRHDRAAGALKVTVDYKGPGTVDKDHQIWVWIFDTPDITADSTPLAVDSLTTNGGTISFTNLPATVYLAAAFDERGGYDGTQGPPPTGTPITIYGEVGAAKAVTTGDESAAVTVTFDDTVRMP